VKRKLSEKSEKKRKKRKKVKKSEKSKKIDLNFASLCFASQQKLLNLSEAKCKAKKSEKSKKIDLNFASLCLALFRFEAKINGVLNFRELES
jgi:hypothetical protein